MSEKMLSLRGGRRTIRWIRWAVLIYQQITFTPLVLLLLLSLSLGMRRSEAYVEWYFSTSLFKLVVFPGCFVNGLNGFAMMIQGRLTAKWPWWKQILTLFGISIPIYGMVLYTKREKELQLRENVPVEEAKNKACPRC